MGPSRLEMLELQACTVHAERLLLRAGHVANERQPEIIGPLKDEVQRLVDSACEAASRSAIESERSRMAGEIHDGLAQSFLAVMMQARAARLGGRLAKQRLLKSLEQIESLAAAGLEESRRSVFALRSVRVESDG